MMCCSTRAAKLASASLLGCALWFAGNLAPAFPLNPMNRLSLPPISSTALDPNLFLLVDTHYDRIGRVTNDQDGVHIRVLKVPEQCDCVLVLAEPTFGQFFKMTDPDALHEIGAAFSRSIAMLLVGDGRPHLDEANARKIKKIFVDALNASLEDDAFATSSTALGDHIKQEIKPRVLADLRSILTNRILDAIRLVIADASQNYGLDFVKGRYSTEPLSEAIDNLVFDPRVIATFGDIIANTIEDSRLNTAIRTIIEQYIHNLVFATLETDFALDGAFSENVIATVHGLGAQGTELAFPGGRTHPVILGLIRNELLPHTTRTDGVLIVMDRDRAGQWFAPERIYEMDEAALR